MARKAKIVYPMLPHLFNPRYVYKNIRGINRRVGTDTSVRKLLSTIISKDAEVLTKYTTLMYYMGRELQRALRDLEARNRVNVDEILEFMSDEYLETNAKYLNITYLQGPKYRRTWSTIKDAKSFMTAHITGIKATRLLFYQDTVQELLEESSTQE